MIQSTVFQAPTILVLMVSGRILAIKFEGQITILVTCFQPGYHSKNILLCCEKKIYFLFPVKENFVSGNLNIILGR